MTRTKRHIVSFRHPFRLKAADRLFAAGDYDVVIDEELIEGLSFPVFRRTGSWIFAPVEGNSSASEMLPFDAADFALARARDLAVPLKTQ